MPPHRGPGMTRSIPVVQVNGQAAKELLAVLFSPESLGEAMQNTGLEQEARSKYRSCDL